MSQNTEGLRRELEALSERVERLEEARDEPARRDTRAADEDEGQFWALTGLRSRLADHPDTRSGAVMILGSLTLPDGSPVAWQQSAGTEGLLEIDWSDHAAAFSALGHPVRLELLRHIVSGVRATAELAEIASLGTTGQLHHHLRQLVAAGWVRQSGRGAYEVPASRIVPLLACVTGAQR
jgi:DNA-binding transcriptional ArsR family regulator